MQIRYRQEYTMRVFVAGASGAIGSRLVSRLIDRGHDVIGSSRSRESAARVQALGAEAIALDLLDPRALRAVVRDLEPEAIIHQAGQEADSAAPARAIRTTTVTSAHRRRRRSGPSSWDGGS